MLFAFVMGVIVGLMFSVNTRLERAHWRQVRLAGMKQMACGARYETNLCRRLAEKLEIQADGGDDPAEFVRGTIEDVWKEADEEAKG